MAVVGVVAVGEEEEAPISWWHLVTVTGWERGYYLSQISINQFSNDDDKLFSIHPYLSINPVSGYFPSVWTGWFWLHLHGHVERRLAFLLCR